jgi:hypothetical protein
MSASASGLRAVRGLRPQFRAQAGLSIEEQLHVAAETEALGSKLLQVPRDRLRRLARSASRW